MRDMREKMRSSNGRERPEIQQNAEFAGLIHRTVEFVETSLSRPLKSHKPLQANFLLKDGGNGCVEFEERLRHSLLDLGRRLQNSGDEDTVDFVMFRLRHIKRHLLHFERYTKVVRAISAVIVLLESEEESSVNHNFPGYCVAPRGNYDTRAVPTTNKCTDFASFETTSPLNNANRDPNENLRHSLGLMLNPVKFFWRLIEYICGCLTCLFFHPPCCTLKSTLHRRVYLLLIIWGILYGSSCSIKSLRRR